MIRQIDEKIIGELKNIITIYLFQGDITKPKELLYLLEEYVTQKMAEAVFANQKKK